MIKDMGGEPLLAESGEEALEVIGRQCPELILTDISMPGMNGYYDFHKHLSLFPVFHFHTKNQL